MFCPLAIDWGNAADWASAIASTSAVVAALWIAFGQERNAHRLRKLARNEEHERKAHLIAEVIRLSGEIEAVAISGSNLVNLGGQDLSSQRDDIEGLRSQLRALQQFPQSDPRIFGEIGRIIHASEMPFDVSTASTSYQGIILRDLAGRMAERRDALAKLLSSLTLHPE
ncbi:hypothetical protein LL253_07925 [Sphingobium soli]|uniref:Uncharacterized protein n=1 Tax=Sphingobium soli TaxID=1591116 RepID=A0ABS8H4V9_9SPHN|nr:hypothetical protein [Sphingobium soli]MCC4232616.1 hypothetical protein [Sphingobium soli]|tara:strand:+ start:292 stop:798 length:507 start_codon:yes stop_codon:yes gene_type:complete